MAISATQYTASGFLGSAPGFNVPQRSPLGGEYVQITGSTGAAGDTTTYTPANGEVPVQVEGGAFTITSVSGATATIKALVALNNDAVVVRMLTRPRLS